MGFFLAFPQLYGKYQGLIRTGYGPPSPTMEAFKQSNEPNPQIAEATTQSDPNASGSNFQKSQPTKFLFKMDKMPDGIIYHQ
jgi:hypothetical protein